jgi:ADP-ribosylglycohydrolase
MTELEKRFIEAYKGLAVCDAVGYRFEFDLGIDAKDVSRYAKDAEVLRISDDTQMTLFTLEAVSEIMKLDEAYFLVNAREYAYESRLRYAYLNWFKTQSSQSISPPLHDDWYNSSLLSVPELYYQRAPGNTCLSALSTLKNGGTVKNDSKGCGSVMRILPIMLLRENYDLEDTIKIGQTSGNVTHKHSENALAIAKYIKAMESLWADSDWVHIIAHRVPQISDIGEGWTAMECVDMGIWAYVNAHSFEELMELSIAHDGDSDSTGAIAGSLWGMAGKKVPDEYVAKLDVPLSIMLNIIQ